MQGSKQECQTKLINKEVRSDNLIDNRKDNRKDNHKDNSSDNRRYNHIDNSSNNQIDNRKLDAPKFKINKTYKDNSSITSSK